MFKYFMNELAYWKAFIVFTLIIGCLIFGLMNAMAFEPIKSQVPYLKMALFTAMLIGFICTMTLHQMRNNSRFWDAAEKIGKLIDEAETNITLQQILDNEFDTLRDFSLGGYHDFEIKRLKGILDTKLKYVK